MDKYALVQDLLAMLDDEIVRAIASAERTRQGATHEEARPENDKDTRALEASYLARGQAQRVVDLQQARQQLSFMDLRRFGKDDAIELSALVLLKSESDAESPESRWYFLTCTGGGRRLEQAGTRIDVLTPEAPLGRALVGKRSGDDVSLRIGGQNRELFIAELR